MYKVSGGGRLIEGLAADQASVTARELRRDGVNDVEIRREDGTRISLYGLEQLIRLECASSSPS